MLEEQMFIKVHCNFSTNDFEVNSSEIGTLNNGKQNLKFELQMRDSVTTPAKNPITMRD